MTIGLMCGRTLFFKMAQQHRRLSVIKYRKIVANQRSSSPEGARARAHLVAAQRKSWAGYTISETGHVEVCRQR
jgi:hypothetical protein